MLYHLPNFAGSTVSLDNLRDRGLGYAFETSIGLANTTQTDGPAGEARGLVVGMERAGRPVGYFPDKQTWQKIPGLDAWVGFYTGQAPGPNDLARSTMLDGHAVELGDGRRWIVPIAVGGPEEGDAELTRYRTLPHVDRLDEDGNWTVGDVLPRYAPLWDAAAAWWDAKWSAAGEDNEAADTGDAIRVIFKIDDARGAAVTILAANYRVSAIEVSLLGLLNDQTRVAILDAAIDWPTIAAWVQKKTDQQTPDISSTDAGPPAEHPATGQPSPTSGD